MKKFKIGSINYTKLKEQAEKKHAAFSRSEKNGEVYINVIVWENETPDKFGFTDSIQLNPPKDVAADKVYIGNLKPPKGAEPAKTEPVKQAAGTDDDIPF